MKITAIGLCPYRQGTGRWDRYHLYKVGMSLDDYVEAGGNRKAFERDLADGSISVDVPPEGGNLPIPVGRGRGTRKKRLSILPEYAQGSVRAGPEREYDPDERIPVEKCAMSSKLSPTVDKFWVFATADDGSKWQLRQEIYSSSEADLLVAAVKELGWIQPKWWVRR